MVTVFYGADAFGLHVAVTTFIAEGEASEPRSAVRFEGSAVSWIALREACGARSLFAARQLLIVKDLLNAWSARGETSGGKGAAKPTPAEFAEFVALLPETTDLVLVEGDLSSTNRYLKPLTSLSAATAQVREFSVPKDAARRDSWATDRVRAMVESRNGSIDPRALRLLAQRCGVDLQRASNEIDKLLSYTAPLYSIGVSDVELLVTDAAETKAFDLADSVCSKNPARAVDLAERLMSDGQAPEQILALVTSRIRDLCLLAHAKLEMVGSDAVALASGWQPWRLGQLQRALAQFSVVELHAAQEMLVAADLALKSRPSHERALVLMLTLFAIARRADGAELAHALAY
jgi:DNA polymerase III delta subunit